MSKLKYMTAPRLTVFPGVDSDLKKSEGGRPAAQDLQPSRACVFNPANSRTEFNIAGTGNAIEPGQQKHVRRLTTKEINERLLEAVNRAPVALMTINSYSVVLAANASCKNILGVPASVLTGKRLTSYLDEDCAARLLVELSGSPVYGSSSEFPLRLSSDSPDERNLLARVTASGNVSGGRVEYIIALLDTSRQQQVERQLRSAKDYLERLATCDALTGLPNRMYFKDALRSAMFNARKTKRPIALLYFDLDGFKGVNDRYGHHVGDGLLREIANRLRIRIREVGRLARLGGDEFTVILEHAGTTESLHAEAGKVLDAIGEPIQVAGTTVNVTASIGVAIYPDFAKSPEQLIQYADAAMYQAKEAGRNCVVEFSVEHQRKLLRNKTLENGISRGIEHSEFFLKFQPIVDSKTGSLDALEVLTRWNHPEFGVVSPDEFIPMAERTGRIVELGYWIFETTCRICQGFRNKGINVRFAINLSPIQLSEENLVDRLLAYVESYSLSPRQFELEITESCIIGNIDSAMRQLEELSSKGFTLAVDDFGTGYSSLARLSRLSVSRIKLDRLFVTELASSEESKIIVNGVIRIARDLSLSVVAEGVEKRSQVDLLNALGCEYLQGFGVYEPCCEDELPDLLTQLLGTEVSVLLKNNSSLFEEKVPQLSVV